MSQKANHFKIGLFVIASATLLVVAIVILALGSSSRGRSFSRPTWMGW